MKRKEWRFFKQVCTNQGLTQRKQLSSPCVLHSGCLLTRFSSSALSSLTQAAEEILHFDPTVVIMAWKAVGRMVCYLKTCSSHVLMACPAITSMCAAMRHQSNECASCGARREKRVSYISCVSLFLSLFSLSSLLLLLVIALLFIHTHCSSSHFPHFAFHSGSTRPVCQVVKIMSFLCYADHQSSSGTCRRSAFLVILCLWWFLFSVCRSLNHVTITLHSAC